MMRARRWLCALGLGLSLALGACAPADDHDLAPGAAQWLMDVRSAHLEVDGAIAAGELERAALLLRRAAALPVPAEVAGEHRRVVLQDLMFRLSEVELDRGAPDAALAAAAAGLGHGRATDLFTANLLIARGSALEASGSDTQAAASYYEALEINRALLARLLEQPDAGPP